MAEPQATTQPAETEPAETEPPRTVVVSTEGPLRFEYGDGREGFFDPNEGLLLRRPLAELVAEQERARFGDAIDELYEETLVPGDGTVFHLSGETHLWGVVFWERHDAVDPQFAQLELLGHVLRLLDSGLSDTNLIPPPGQGSGGTTPTGTEFFWFDVRDLDPSLETVTYVRVEVDVGGVPRSLSVIDPSTGGAIISGMEPATIEFPVVEGEVFVVDPPPLAADRAPLVAAVRAMTSEVSYQFHGLLFDSGGYTTSPVGYLWNESRVDYFGSPFFFDSEATPSPVAWVTDAWSVDAEGQQQSEEIAFLEYLFLGAPGLEDDAMFGVEQDADDIASNRYRVVGYSEAPVEGAFLITLTNDGFVQRVEFVNVSGPFIEFSNFGEPLNFPVRQVIVNGLDIYCGGTLELEDCS